MKFRGFVSYKNDNINVITFDDNIHMRIEKFDAHIVKMYFVNNQNNDIPIPKGITLRESLHNYNVPQLPSGSTSCFLMSWVGQYSLFRNGIEVCAFKNKKQQAIEGVDELSYSVIQR
ncbi:hypothetical protein Glove_535g23 [Diversispora epigaea]|uniref:Uncharacterized protein n=1 Tax=Diversispora epigaea TaxID=1348612 RepID=A0A397GGR3_9GLOM|nr:hypothetical protein Glove_535g23 [Diversispora epigaea]